MAPRSLSGGGLEGHTHNQGQVIEMSTQNGQSEWYASDTKTDREHVRTVEMEEEPEDEKLRATKSTRDDAANMYRMGKDQQLVRHFRQLSIISFTAIATAAWEIGLFVISPGLIDGGRSGLIYNTLWNFFGFLPIYLSTENWW